MIDYQFKLNFEVRDYECDLGGIVNNAVYQHYLEHTRHIEVRLMKLYFYCIHHNAGAAPNRLSICPKHRLQTHLELKAVFGQSAKSQHYTQQEHQFIFCFFEKDAVLR